MDDDALLDAPDALADALGEVVDEMRAAWRQEMRIMAAESAATIAGLRGEIAELKSAFAERANVEFARIPAALALVKDGRDGIDGKSIEPQDVHGLVAAEVKHAFASIPAPKDGADGRTPTTDDILPLVAEQVKAAVAALPAAEPGPLGPAGESIKGDQGPQGDAGPPPDPDEIADLIRREVEKAIANLPPPKDGADGVDGKSIDPAEIERMLDEVVARLPVPKDGLDGKDVDPALVKALIVSEAASMPRPQDGRDGRDGKDADWTAIERRIELSLKQAVADLPPPRDGIDGINGTPGADGRDGIDGINGTPGADGRDGIDGIDGKSVTVDDIAPLVETVVEKRVAALADQVAVAVEKLPRPKDGHDGIGLKDAFISISGELMFILDDGTIKNVGIGFAKDFNIDAIRQLLVDIIVENKKGIWEPLSYKKGNEVTYGGSRFLALVDTEATDRPSTESDSKWELINSRGRPGKDAPIPKDNRPPMYVPPQKTAE